MTIRTIEEYRASITKRPQRSSARQGTEAKYFIAGYVGAASTAQEQEGKANKKVERTRQPVKWRHIKWGESVSNLDGLLPEPHFQEQKI